MARRKTGGMAASPPLYSRGHGLPLLRLPLLSWYVHCLALAALLHATQGDAIPDSYCPNDCDFHFDGLGNGTIPQFYLVNSPHGAVPISPRIVYGPGLPVHVHASGPAVLLTETELKTVSTRWRSAQQTREHRHEPVGGASIGLEEAQNVLVDGDADSQEEERKERDRVIQYSFYVVSASGNGRDLSTTAPAFVYERPMKNVEDWKAATGRCMKVFLIKFRIYYRRTKFLYFTEGDGNSFLPESRRCVAFRSR